MNSAGKSSALTALALLLGINLFNYIDRQVLAAVEPEIRATFFSAHDPNAMAKTGSLVTAFLITYMLTAPILGWLADRFSRWVIIGCAVVLWSLASGASGLAATFGLLFLTRVFVGVGEGGYGPAAPTILADLFPLATRGRVLATFCAAIPVGSALGYVLGGLINVHLGWRWAFYLVTPPGLLLGALCFWQRDPRTSGHALRPKHVAGWPEYLQLAKTPSFALNCFAQTAMTFSLGGIAFWMPAYLRFRGQPDSARIWLGVITVVAGLISTIAGGSLGDRLRKRFPGSYFLVSGIGMLLAFPLFLAMLRAPFPSAWFYFFGAVFFVFLNTGPSNTALANVAMPAVRATAFAINILIIHALGDAISPPVIGAVAGHWNMNVGFILVSAMMLVSGVIWMIGAPFLAADTAVVEKAARS